MTALNHTVTGALVAAAIGEPVIALPAALLSHFAIDILPHWDYKLPGGLVMRQAALMIDITFSLFVLLILAITVDASRRMIIAGGFLGAVPDLMWAQYLVTGKAAAKPNKFIEPLRRFHLWIQRSETRAGIYFEVFWLVLTLYLIYQI